MNDTNIFNYGNYHVMEIAYDGSVRELFALEETGMELDRAPLLNMEDDCLYVLFDGMDNEDRTDGSGGPLGRIPRDFYRGCSGTIFSRVRQRRCPCPMRSTHSSSMRFPVTGRRRL